MNSIIVPVDFSATAKNAAQYAIEFGKEIKIPRIVLYHTYQTNIVADPMASALAVLTLESVKEEAEKTLEQLKTELQKLAGEEMAVEALAEYGVLASNIKDAAINNNAAYIIMGITGGGALEETLIGSNTIEVAKHSSVPVIIVPPKTIFSTIKKILLACDFKDTRNILPTDTVIQFLQQTKAELHILHVEKTNADFSSNTVFESVALETLLGDFNPQYHFINNKNFTDAVNQFAVENKIDMAIILPKKHNLLDSLLHKSHTKSLAFHSTIPLMAIHN